GLTWGDIGKRRLQQLVRVREQFESVENPRRFLEVDQRLRRRLQLVVEHRRSVEYRYPGVERFGDDRRGLGQRFRTGLKGSEELGRVLEEGADRRQVGVDLVQRRRAFFDRFLDVGAGDAGEGGKGAVEGDEHLRLGLGKR